MTDTPREPPSDKQKSYGPPLTPRPIHRKPKRSNTLAVARDDQSRVLDLAVKRGLVDNVSAREALFESSEARKNGKSVPVTEVLIRKGLITKYQADELLAPAPASEAPVIIRKESVRRAGPPARGDTIGGYRIMDKIGEGAFGAVYRAVQVTLDRTVALKLLPERLAGNPQYTDRFLREAKIAARLEHPNVVRAIDAGEDRGRYYFVMELVEGRSLEQVLAERSSLDDEETIDVAFQSARGLEYAWRSGLVHRDIKPENLLVTHDGIVKIADLGLAKSIGQDQDAKLTQEGVALGTPAYVSPEQAQAEDVDIRTDIYALGLTLYRCTCGRLPFENTDPVKLVAQRLSEDAPPIRSFNQKVSRELATLIETMIQRDREARHPDPVVLLSDLVNVSAGRKPEYACARGRARAQIVEAAHRVAGDRTSTMVTSRIQYRPDVMRRVLPIAGGVAALLFFILWMSGPSSASIPILEEALRGRYEHAGMMLAESKSSLSRKEYDNLVQLIRRARLLDAGRLAEAEGRRAEAIERYEQALSIEDDPVLRERLDRLR